MRTRWLTVWLPLVGLSACVVGLLLLPATNHCVVSPGLCNQQGMLRDVVMMTLPLLFLALRGSIAGAQQVRRTRTLVQTMLALPRSRLTTDLMNVLHKLHLDGRVSVVEYTVPEAFCYGFLRPRICLTTGLLATLSLPEVEAVLRHERHHLRHYDPLRTLVWTIVSRTLWWLEDHAQHAHLLRELAADRAVITEQGRPPLASALFKLLTSPPADQASRAGVAVSGISVTDARIDQLLDPEQRVTSSLPVWRWLIISILLLLTVPLCSVMMAWLVT